MKILVPLKRVADPDNANKVKVTAGQASRPTGLEWKPNPFDEYAVETALRLTENGANPKARLGEVVVVTFGPKETETTLRAALATGADRAIRVDATDDQLDGDVVARALKAIVEKEKPDLVLMGKQAVDGDSNQVGQLLAEYLGWPHGDLRRARIKSEDGKALLVGREVDGGVDQLRVKLPAVVTVDLRIVAPTSVDSKHDAPTLQVQRRRPLRGAHGDHGGEEEAARRDEARRARRADTALKITYTGFELPPRAQGRHQGQGRRRAGREAQDRSEGPLT